MPDMMELVEMLGYKRASEVMSELEAKMDAKLEDMYRCMYEPRVEDNSAF